MGWATFATIGICLLALGALLVPACTHQLQPLRIASSPQPISANVYAAQVLGHFQEEGLAVELLSYPSGKAALNAVLNGEADLATVAETPLMHAVVAGQTLRCYASLSESHSSVQIVGRRDLGIHHNRDLVDITIALPRGTNGEIYFLNHLRFINLPLTSVTIVDLMPEQAMQALLEGEVQAVSLWEPHTSDLVEHLGPRATVLHEDAPYRWSLLLVGADGAAPQSSIISVLRAIERSNRSLDPISDQLLAQLADSFDTPPERLRRLIGEQHYRLKLGGTVAIKMELQASQLHGPEVAGAVDFAAILDPRALTEVDPAAVTAVLP